MPRYFLEVFYKGESFSGSQIQNNANTIQSEIEKAFFIFFKKKVSLTGSSRTDAGVHALQNFFHFDWDENFQESVLYNINAIISGKIVVKSIKKVKADSNSRYDAISREYKYYINSSKNPFLEDRSWFIPYPLDLQLLNECAKLIRQNKNFKMFSKQNTQAKTFDCAIYESIWTLEKECLIYSVKANRFLRGMVRGLVGTMIKVARGTISISDFQTLLENNIQSTADFSAPAKGLFLIKVSYPNEVFISD
jgi:tRNA pseudouridine38-40 synthase